MSFSQKLRSGYELPSTELLGVFHGEEEVKMADDYTQQHGHPTGIQGERSDRERSDREKKV